MTVQPTRDQLRALADQAARGPWTVDDGGGYDFSVTQGADGDYIASDVTPRDAEFIAAARTALPQLLDQLDAAEQRIRNLTQEVKDERGAALDQMEQVHIRDTRIQAVEDVLDRMDRSGVPLFSPGHLNLIRRALESVPPPRA